jgi:hypothetical protein
MIKYTIEILNSVYLWLLLFFGSELGLPLPCELKETREGVFVLI